LEAGVGLQQLHRVEQVPEAGGGVRYREHGALGTGGAPAVGVATDRYFQPVHAPTVAGSGGHGTGHETVQHSAMVDVCVLGTVEIRAPGRVVALPRGGERCVLATLAFSPGRRVHVDVLVDH